MISAADAPSKPSFPKKRLMVLGGLTIGAGTGIALATLIELLRGGLRSMDQVEDTLGVKCLGLVPRLKPLSRRRLRARELPRLLQATSPQKPRDHVFRQSVRNVEFKLLNSDRDNSRVILVTAALPEEGKTSIAVSLAISLAADGFRVVLVDCDIHKPTVHRMFNGDGQLGLADYLVDGSAVEEIIHNDDTSGVDYIPAGTQTASEACSITPDRLHSLIDRLGRQYPFIILDSGPVLAVPETLALSQLADKTILAVRWGRTPVTVVRHAIAQLLDSGAEVAAVLSMVDLQRSAKHGDLIAGTYQQLERYHRY
jgi:capsular exopolysaccharide synthesis family protein